MRVIFAIPALTNSIHLQCMTSLMSAMRALTQLGIEYDLYTVANCPVISVARNSLTAMFLEDENATDLFFIDSDVGFDPAAVVAMLHRSEEIVAGVYPLKRDSGGFPVQVMRRDGIPIGRDGLVEAEMLPGGFMRIKRQVFETLKEKYPELAYEDDYVAIEGSNLKGGYNFWGMGIYDNTFRTEDFAFSQRWRDIGGRLWVYPDIDFEHIGMKAYKANYHKSLMENPGGCLSSIANAVKIDGWMSIPELDWLAKQAAKHYQIVEIGSWMGRSTRALADNTPGRVIAVDTWQGSAEHQEALAGAEPRALYAAFLRNVDDCTNIVAYGHESVVAASMLSERRFDMVFIDGSHDYESVKSDLEAWLPLVCEGGLLCGHDYDWPGVQQAVKELVPGALVIPGTSIWAVEVGASKQAESEAERCTDVHVC